MYKHLTTVTLYTFKSNHNGNWRSGQFRANLFSSTYIPTYIPIYLHTYIHAYIHTYQLLKLDKQTRSRLVVQVCIEPGICTAPHPLQALCLVCCKKWLEDGGTNLFV